MKIFQTQVLWHRYNKGTGKFRLQYCLADVFDIAVQIKEYSGYCRNDSGPVMPQNRQDGFIH
jgi:hypothetical protein